jgi:hypothetical protein
VDLGHTGRECRRRLHLAAQSMSGSRESRYSLDDEIGEIQLTVQRQLLRPLQARFDISGREQELSRDVSRRKGASVQDAAK